MKSSFTPILRRGVLAGVTAALIMFLLVEPSLRAALKYPANPPGVGEADTINERTMAYLSFIATGIAILCVAHYLRRWLATREWSPAWNATTTVAAAVLLASLALWAWPASPDPIPPDVPAGLVWQFRLGSLAQLAGLWAVLGFTFGLLGERRSAEQTVRTAAARARWLCSRGRATGANRTDVGHRRSICRSSPAGHGYGRTRVRWWALSGVARGGRRRARPR